jgi:hypothetical protein
LACKGICALYYKAKKPYIRRKKGKEGGGDTDNNGSSSNIISSRYSIGQKRCQICELFIEFDGVLCPCYNSKLRTRPRGYCFSARLLLDETIARY